jgi:hypothetical protein
MSTVTAPGRDRSKIINDPAIVPNLDPGNRTHILTQHPVLDIRANSEFSEITGDISKLCF